MFTSVSHSNTFVQPVFLVLLLVDKVDQQLFVFYFVFFRRGLGVLATKKR